MTLLGHVTLSGYRGLPIPHHLESFGARGIENGPKHAMTSRLQEQYQSSLDRMSLAEDFEKRILGATGTEDIHN